MDNVLARCDACLQAGGKPFWFHL